MSDDDFKPIDFSSYPVLPYWTKVRGPLFEVLATIQNRVDRDLRADLDARANGACTWLLTHVRVAQQTQELVEEITGLVKAKALKLQVGVNLPPLVRTVFDSVCSVMFVFENPNQRLPWFWKSTWREIVEEHEELTADYGGDATWKPFIDRLGKERDAWSKLLDEHGTPLTAVERADHTKVPYWPNPGKMASKSQEAARKERLKYISLKYYGTLSGASHLSGTGLLAQGGVFVRDATEDGNKKYLSDQILKGLDGLFSLVSEIAVEVIRDPTLARRVIGLWQSPNLWRNATETYDRCFKSRLEGLAAR